MPDADAEKPESEEQPEQEREVSEVVADPVAMAMQAMVAFEDRRFLVQTVAVGAKDPNGMRELTFPIAPAKQITLVLAAELCDHIMKEFSGGIEVADLADLAEVKAAVAASEGEKKS